MRDVSPAVAAGFDAVAIPGALAWALDLPAPSPPRRAASSLDAPTGRTAILAGPGVLRARAVEGLRALAEAAHVGVANTWGAKGVLTWNSPYHLGTCGLQEHDFELCGFADLDALWVTGLDPAESPHRRLDLARLVALDPRDLAIFATRVARSPHRIERPPLFDRISAIAGPGYEDDRVPRHPARAVMDVKRALGPDDVVTAEPGPAGLWFARTFPTDNPGTVIVPALDTPGIGAAVAIAAARGGRPTTAVGVGPPTAATAELVDLAARLELPVRLQRWGDDVDLSLTEMLVHAAGPVVAWTT